MFRKNVLNASIVAALSIAVVACDDSTTLSTDSGAVIGAGNGAGNGVADGDPNAAAIRVIHASPDAPAVNVSLNGGEAISALGYGESSGFATLEAGEYDVAVDGILPGGTATVITVDDLNLAAGSQTTVVAVGNVADIGPLVVADSAATPAADQISLTVTHAAPGAPTVELYLLAPDASRVTPSPSRPDHPSSCWSAPATPPSPCATPTPRRQHASFTSRLTHAPLHTVRSKSGQPALTAASPVATDSTSPPTLTPSVTASSHHPISISPQARTTRSSPSGA